MWQQLHLAGPGLAASPRLCWLLGRRGSVLRRLGCGLLCWGCIWAVLPYHAGQGVELGGSPLGGAGVSCALPRAKACQIPPAGAPTRGKAWSGGCHGSERHGRLPMKWYFMQSVIHQQRKEVCSEPVCTRWLRAHRHPPVPGRPLLLQTTWVV